MPFPSPALFPGSDVLPGIPAVDARVRWLLTLADRQGNGLGEILQATGRALKFSLNRPPTVGFTARVDNALAPDLVLDDLTLVQAYLKVDDDPAEIEFCGPIITHEKIRNTDGGTIAVVAAGPAWRLGLRRIGLNNAGCTLTPVPPARTGDLARIIIDALNSGDTSTVFSGGSDTGIRTPAGPITAGSPNGVGPWYYKQALEALGDLSSPLDGFDWRVDPVEPEPDALGVKLGELVVADAFGQQRPDAVFEFGAGRGNIAEFHELGDANQLCNLAYSLPEGFPDASIGPVLAWANGDSINQRGVYEDVIASDVTVDALRLALIQEHVAIRGTPRIIYQITPVPDRGDGSVPRYGIDYGIGDLLPFRATERFPVRDASTGAVIGWRDEKTIDGWVRVYQVELALDDEGTASPTITIIESDL